MHNKKRKPMKGVAKSRALTIRMAEDDIARAREQAGHLGLPYQTYLKSLLHQALLAGESKESR